MSLPESAASGNRLATLRDLRDLLAVQIAGCDSLRDLAALSGRLQDVLLQIDQLAPPAVEVDAVDEITARRAARGAGPSARSARTRKA